MSTTLKVTRAKDRAAMAETVRAIFAASPNGTVTVEPDGSNSIVPRRTSVSFVHAGGIAVHVEFDGDSAMDREGSFCMPWHTITNTDACMSNAFGFAVHGSINPHHFSKCTTFANGFDDLCKTLRRAVECLDSGAAYDAERQAAKIAKEGTWQQRAAKWEQWRQEWQAELDARKAVAA